MLRVPFPPLDQTFYWKISMKDLFLILSTITCCIILKSICGGGEMRPRKIEKIHN